MNNRMIALVVILLFIGASFLFILKDREKEKSLPPGDGIVTNVWLGQDGFDLLKKNEIRYIFVDVGDISEEGVLTTPEDEMESFISLVKDRDSALILPYTEINTENYDFASEDFRKNIISMYQYLMDLGFDGAYLDIEPVKFGERDQYLDFIRQVRQALPRDSIVCVYSGALGESDNEWEWSRDFYRSVSPLVDMIVVPGYDTDIEDDDAYRSFVVSQVDAIQASDFDTHFLLGVPTHKESPETIENSLESYHSADSRFLGVALFAEWTMDADEWGVYRRYRR